MERYLGILKFFLILVICFTFFYSFVQSQEDEVIVVPYSGSSKEIWSDLYDKGFIKNKLSYYTLLTLSKFYKEVQPGGYNLRKGMGALAVYSEISNPNYRYVFIEEGLRKEQIADKLALALEWDDEKKKSFSNTFDHCQLTGGEGYLFPGKYLIHKDETPEVIKTRMYQKLFENLGHILNDPDKNILNTNQIVTIASLIQREAAGKHDMRLISGVIWNRLFSDTPLQIDATLQYVKGKEGLWWPRVYSKDKYLDSPYNTYENKGLPPGPIANPGQSAIEAALNPADTDCLFYIHDASRNIHCSTTYEGHQQNISYYLK